MGHILATDWNFVPLADRDTGGEEGYHGGVGSDDGLVRSLQHQYLEEVLAAVDRPQERYGLGRHRWVSTREKKSIRLSTACAIPV